MKTKIFITFLATAMMVSSCKYKFDDQEDPSPNKDPIYKLLTGNNKQGKTWKVTNGPYEIGIGPKSTLTPDYYNFPDGNYSEAWLLGIGQNNFTFTAEGNKFVPKNQNATAHYAYANRYFGLSQPEFTDAVVTDPNLKQANFILKNENNGIGTGYTLEITGGSYFGRFDKRNKYQILSISKDTLKIRHLMNDDAYADPSLDEVAWYSTYVTE